MLTLPVPTALLKPSDDLAIAIANSVVLQTGDIVIVSSKAVATVENAYIQLDHIQPSAEAIEWSEKTRRSPAFCQAVLDETTARGGKVVGHCPGALLTELCPSGLGHGSILIADAGLDESNAPHGITVGWPIDPVTSTKKLRIALEATLQSTGNVAVIMTDSCVHPRRRGVLAFALTVSGIDPLQSEVGKLDVFGKPLHITTEAIADQLATVGNFLMGNAGQSTPAAIIRDHGLQLSAAEGWVPAIEPSEDLFRGIL